MVIVGPPKPLLLDMADDPDLDLVAIFPVAPGANGPTEVDLTEEFLAAPGFGSAFTGRYTLDLTPLIPAIPAGGELRVPVYLRGAGTAPLCVRIARVFDWHGTPVAQWQG
jgi:hypothetical protein